MGNYLDEKVKEFWGGFIVGGYSGVKFLFADPTGWDHMVLEYTLRFLGAIFIAATSGVLTAMTIDLYKYKIKDKLFKPKENDKEEDQKAA